MCLHLSVTARGELPESERVSLSQMGAFFGGMTLRANAFPEPTTWQPGERAAMESMWPLLQKHLPPEVLFLADPDGSIFGSVPRYTGGDSEASRRLVTALREVLFGGHMGFEETLGLLHEILPLRRCRGASTPVEGGASDALVAAYLICVRMNRETDRELKAFCLAFDWDAGSPPPGSLSATSPPADMAPVADVASLTHYGEPYDGSLRFFRPSLFVAAVRASYGESCLLHGVPWMPPKVSVGVPWLPQSDSWCTLGVLVYPRCPPR